MVEAKGRYDWGHTSSLMALMVNLVRDPKHSSPAKPSDFNPYTPQIKKPMLRGKELSILKHVFVKQEARKENNVNE